MKARPATCFFVKVVDQRLGFYRPEAFEESVPLQDKKRKIKNKGLKLIKVQRTSVDERKLKKSNTNRNLTSLTRASPRPQNFQKGRKCLTTN